jgi:hypothetical protein
LAPAEAWGPIDRSHRKLAHGGSYLERVWVAPSTVRRVLAGHDVDLPAPASRPTRPERKPWRDWVEAEGLIGTIANRLDTGKLPAGDQIPILLAVSDNGPPTNAADTRSFMALCSIAQHFRAARRAH